MPRRSLSSSTTVGKDNTRVVERSEKTDWSTKQKEIFFILLPVRFSVTILDDNATLRMAPVNPLIL